MKMAIWNTRLKTTQNKDGWKQPCIFDNVIQQLHLNGFSS